MSPDTLIQTTGGEMSARQAASLFSSENNPSHTAQLLADGFLAGMTAGEGLNDFSDTPAVQAEIAVASDVLRLYHAAVGRCRWRDIVNEQPLPGEIVESRITDRDFIAGEAQRSAGVWSLVKDGQPLHKIDLWRPREEIAAAATPQLATAHATR